MSLSLRHRTGLILAGLVIAAPLFGSGPASAAVQTITFTGKPLRGSALSCPSTPSKTDLTVTAGTIVNFVNRTGRTATLWAGEAEKSLPDESLVPVTFNGGPSSVVIQMLPDCALDLGKHIRMTVHVVAAGSPIPAPSTSTSGMPSGLPATTAPAHTGSSSGYNGTASPGPSKSSGGAAVAPKPSDNDPFAQAPSTSEIVRPVIGQAVGQTDSSGASGLLTLIATVGVVGVSAAAIRAIVAQRTIRPLTA
jgi:hypothetical protein